LDIIQTCLEEIPGTKTAAYFDTTFHQSLPDYVKTYPIDPEVAKSKTLRKYGFHGISYSFILRAVAEFLQKPPNSTNIIALHLGSGASACAIRNGQSADTSYVFPAVFFPPVGISLRICRAKTLFSPSCRMGLTPVAGLPGASRSGDIDPRYGAFRSAPPCIAS
jgi:acetate kinase